MSGIYIIRNTKNGRVYVGRANSIAERWKQHRRKLRRGCHTNTALQWDWVFYGEDCFEFHVVEEINGYRFNRMFFAEREYAHYLAFRRIGPVYNTGFAT